MHFRPEIIAEYWKLIVSGIPIILSLALICAIMGTVLGLLCTLLRKSSNIGDKIVSAYIDIFRGTPVYVQLYVVYYGIPSLIEGFTINSFLACVIVFSLNSGSYLAEIIRSGVEAIDKGQIEAAKALGVKTKDIAFDIIIPQAFRNCLPAVINEFITLTKETSVISVVGMHDMMYWFMAVKNITYSSFEGLLVVFIAYYIMNKILSLGGKWVERKLQYD